MLFIWTTGIIFHHPRFPWNKTKFPLLFTSIWGDLFWPPLPHPKKKKRNKIRDTKAFSMVQSANVITLLKRWWTTNTTPNALLNLRFLVFSWKKGGGSGSVSHWSVAPKKVTTRRILRKPKRSLAKGKICLNLHLGSSMLQKSCYLHLPIIVCNNHNFQKNPVMRWLNHWKVTGPTGKLPNLNQFFLDFVFAVLWQPWCRLYRWTFSNVMREGLLKSYATGVPGLLPCSWNNMKMTVSWNIA